MDYKIKITGSGTIEQLALALKTVADSITSANIEGYTGGVYEDPIIVTTVSEATDDEDLYKNGTYLVKKEFDDIVFNTIAKNATIEVIEVYGTHMHCPFDVGALLINGQEIDATLLHSHCEFISRKV